MTKLKTIIVRSKTTKAGRTKVTASAPTPDRYNDIVAADWNLDHFKSNPVVVWAHDYSLPPVGRVLDIELKNNALIANIEWDDSPSNKLGQTVASQFKRGFLNAVSVGFTPGDSIERSKLDDDHPAYGKSGFLYTNNELMEISAVPIPAHRDAIAIRQLNKSGAIMAAPVNKHIMNVEETEDSYTITFHKVVEDLDEEPVEEQMEDDDEEKKLDDDDEYKAVGDEDEDEDPVEGETDEDDDDEDDEDENPVKGKSFERSVRSALLKLMGDNPDILEQRSVTLDSLSDVFGIDK
tara:strand:- start:12872 stop:13750 length:879 start_codon:yes stop_codon:yes gene_type:complete